MHVNRVNNISFQGVLVGDALKKCSVKTARDIVEKSLTEDKILKLKDHTFQKKKFSVEITIPKDAVKKAYKPQGGLEQPLMIIGEILLYKLFKGKYPCIFTGETAEAVKNNPALLEIFLLKTGLIDFLEQGLPEEKKIPRRLRREI